jgi:hypothetical protein
LTYYIIIYNSDITAKDHHHLDNVHHPDQYYHHDHVDHRLLPPTRRASSPCQSISLCGRAAGKLDASLAHCFATFVALQGYQYVPARLF